MPDQRLAKARQGYEGYVYQPPTAFRIGARHEVLAGRGVFCPEPCDLCDEFQRRMADRPTARELLLSQRYAYKAKSEETRDGQPVCVKEEPHGPAQCVIDELYECGRWMTGDGAVS